MGVGVGVATHDGDVRLAVRYTFEQFEAGAARRFTDTYVERLDEMV